MTFRTIAQGATLIAAVVCSACDVDFRRSSGLSSGRRIPVYVEVAVAERATPALHVPAVVEPSSSRLLAFRYAGRIERVRVAAGARVAAGDVLAELDLVGLERRVEVARAALDRAQMHVVRGAARGERREQLYELAAGTRRSFAPGGIERVIREAEARYARATLADAEARFAAGVLRAPVAGVVDQPFRESGTRVSAGEPIVRLNGIHPVRLRAVVPRSVSSLVREGGRASVSVGEERRFGSIRRIVDRERSSDGASLEVSVDNTDELFRLGEVVELVVDVEGRESRSSISLASLQRGVEARPFCFVVVGDGADLRVERRSVALGGLRGDRVLLLSGLEAGERVVSLGNELLTVGDSVTVVGEGR